MRKETKVGTKLLASFGGLLGVALLLSAAALVQNGGLSQELDRAVRVTARKQYLAGDISASVHRLLAAERGLVLAGILQQTAAVEGEKQVFSQEAADVEKALQEYAALEQDLETQNLSRALSGELRRIFQAHHDMVMLLDKQQFDQIQRLFDQQVLPVARRIEQQTEVLVSREGQALAGASSRAEARAAAGRWIILVFVAVALAVGAVVLLIVRQVNRRFSGLAGQVAGEAQEVAEGAAQVCAASQLLARGAGEQAASLEQTSATMEELHAVTQKNRESSKSSAELMGAAERAVGEAARTVHEMSLSMREIAAAGDRIKKVVKLIDDIAFQTRILSLNAAVEAARAGGAGAGFAVVAEQVGRLAEECASAARETGGMIEETVSRVTEGEGRLGRAVSAIQAIVSQAAQVKQLVEEVHLGNREQADGIQQVVKAVARMQELTQRTAASAQQNAATGEMLDQRSKSLNQVVWRIGELVGTGDGMGRSERAKPSAAQKGAALNRPRI